ncbi:hypothetical protein [Granulicella sibirica]|uniref:Uncharacterized protein n=1 Tax=Granulicella sibirica TaxID=2479048 RepID=A0A4Q0T1M7_9BACT|nr:hypothetical protein [Granulicella sibirica]RXH57483.1 hypothetical protein GRAN_0793 [Granulicella sibirica]
MTEETTQSPAAIAVPLLASLIVTSAAAFLICTPPSARSLTWPTLLGHALLFVAIAAAAHALAVWLACRVFRDQIETPAVPLIAGLWMATAWLPLLALLFQEDSPWIVAVPPVIAIYATFFLRKWKPAPEPHLSHNVQSSLFDCREPPPFLRTVLPAVLTSIALEAGITLLVLGYSLPAGILIAAGAALSLWALPTKSRTEDKARKPSINALITESLTIIVLTAIALIPFLRQGRFAILHAVHAKDNNPSVVHDAKTTGSDYSGIILILPLKPHPDIVPPVPITRTNLASTRSKPVLIPFDGVYWYFKKPDLRPKPDARTVQGDPTKANVRSTDFQALSMEAHQSLGAPLSVSCCSALRVALQNADNRLGAIDVEILLTDKTSTKNPSAESLGTLAIASSEAQTISLTRPPINEVLTFPIPASAHGKEFDEITVRIKPSKERSRAGAHIAIQHFELVP